MKILCTICARGGSTGVKNKNIRLLRGKPLIAHSLLQAKKSQLFDCIGVSSDSEKILTIAKQWGANYLIRRPMELASHSAPKIPAIQHAVLETEKSQGTHFDLIVDLDVTSPLRLVEDILNAVQMIVEHPEATNLVTAAPSRRSPYFNMLEKNSSGSIRLVKKPEHAIARRQDVPVCYDMNASIYIWRRTALFNSSSLINDNTLLYVMPEERSLDVDSLIDWKFLLLLAKQRKDLVE